MTGWEVHGGRSHPVLDGWVVCKEHAQTLIDAWHEEEARRETRLAEVRFVAYVFIFMF
jgi:hypothetical protein